jgi:hypothetical protein
MRINVIEPNAKMPIVTTVKHSMPHSLHMFIIGGGFGVGQEFSQSLRTNKQLLFVIV